MSKIFVIAGNNHEYSNYIRDKNRPDYFYVSGIDYLKGYRQPRGVFIGTWYLRQDAADIIYQLRVVGSISLDKMNELLEHMTSQRRKWW